MKYILTGRDAPQQRVGETTPFATTEGTSAHAAMAPQDRAALRTTKVLDNLSVPHLLAKCCI